MAAQSRTKQALAIISQALPKEQILGLVVEGKTLRQIAAIVLLKTGKDYSTYYICKALQAYGQDYEDAKVMQSHTEVDQVKETSEDLKQGKIDPATARVVSDNSKWIAARRNPREYGDRIQADIAITDMTALHMEALRLKLAGKTVAKLIDEDESSD